MKNKREDNCRKQGMDGEMESQWCKVTAFVKCEAGSTWYEVYRDIILTLNTV